jgi:B3 DNA binding domain
LFCKQAIPKKFSTEHLKRENLEVILSCPDQEKTWFVTSYFRLQRKEQMFRGATLENFVKENNLKQDDLCLFELVKDAERLMFVVHTSRTTNILDS